MIPCDYRHKWYTAKTTFFGLHISLAETRSIFNHVYVIVHKSYQIRRNNSNYTAVTQFTVKVTHFGTNRKPICDFVLVINNNYLLSCTVSKLRPIIGQIFASDRGVPHFNAPDRGDPLRIFG